MHNKNESSPGQQFIPRLIFWELTTACNLKCMHCRACPVDQRSPEDMTTQECKSFLDEISSFASPAVVLSGGEPLVRPDIFDIASYGTSKGLRMLLATNGTLVTPDTAKELVNVGIQRVAISIDGATAATHDSFRRIDGAFQAAWNGIECLKAAGLPYQINTTVSKHNINEIPEILNMAVNAGAVALHLFLLVPTGCGKEIADDEMIDPQEYERVLNWFYDRSKDSPINLKATCAPHYYRIMRQRAKADGTKIQTNAHGHDAVTKGCLAGSAVCFVSHKGEVYPCGYLTVSAGNIRETNFKSIWDDAEVFRVLRNEDNLEGKCGHCEYRRVCMGCRARAFAYTGNYLAPEPYCIYEPGAGKQDCEGHQVIG